MESDEAREVTDHLLTTTRSVRRRLDLERPVDPRIVVECIEIATQAPSGSNSQGWRWIVVTDQEKRTALAELYRAGGSAYVEWRLAQATTETERKLFLSAQYLLDVLDQVPVLVVPCVWGSTEGQDEAGLAGLYGSILPATWSFMLALRSRGLASAWTTFHLHDAAAAARLLAIPEGVTQAALLPVAHSIGTQFQPAPRRDVHEIVYWNEWKGPLDA